MTFTGRGLYAASSKEPRGRSSGWLLIGAALALAVLVGGALLSFGSVELGGDTRSDDFSGVEKVEVRTGSGGDVTVHGTEDDEVTVERSLRGTPFADPRERLEADGGTVKAEATCGGGAWFLGDCAVDYTISVPEGTAVSVDSASGDVELDEVVGTVDVSAGSGSIRGEDLTGDIRAATTTGEIDLGDVEGDVEMESNTGSISAEGSGGTVTAETTTGEVDLEEFAAESFDVETTTGSVNLEAGFAKARVETTTGSVGIEALKPFDSLEVDTTTGSVEVDVPEGSYRVTGDSTTGERDVDVDTSAAGGAPRIAVSTTTGSFNIEAED
ncbi:hypothetical protein GCM10023224_39420 [Streptomonospora halophila]|uniref:DUF4097 domain-containing protein n=1 Tax=Streptomonospora halophila TaxID=427369 RepID=A0ABP9GTD2_9ACTN